MLTDRYYFTSYDAKDVLVMDLSDLAAEDVVSLIDKANEAIRKNSRDSKVVMVNASNLTINKEVLNALMDFVKNNEDVVKYGIIYGVSFLQAFAIQSFSKSTSMVLKCCKSEKEARKIVKQL